MALIISLPTILARVFMYPGNNPNIASRLCTSKTRIAMLAGVFILLLGPPKSDRLKD